MPQQSPHLAVHALHTTTGGGLVYLNNILPILAEKVAHSNVKLTVFVRPETMKKIKIPQGVQVVDYTMPHSFFKAHMKAQVFFPWVLRTYGVTHTLCNANFVPLLAPRPSPIIHTTPTVSRFTTGLFWAIYWKILWSLTLVSLLRAPVAFSVAEHVILHYTPWPFKFLRKKVHVASPAAAVYDMQAERVSGRCIAVGDFYIQKDFPTLIAAFARVKKRVPHATLTIVGRPLMADITQQLKEAIAAHGLSECVNLTGGLPHHALMAEVAAAEVLISTSIAECFNMPLLEAMQIRTAVVAADTDFQQEVVGNGENARLVEQTPTAYADAIVTLLTDNKSREQQVNAAYKHAQTFTWQKSAHIIADALLA